MIVLVILAARSSLASHYLVPSGSMQPTIEIGDRVWVNKLAYGIRLPFSHFTLVEFEKPQRGDVVVCESPEDGELLIKRVAAIPGDVVEVRSGRILINDSTMPVTAIDIGLVETLGKKQHPMSLSEGGGPDFGPLKIPEEQYLLIGDNRGNSRDGRWFGLVSRTAILGRAEAIFFNRGNLVWKDL